MRTRVGLTRPAEHGESRSLPVLRVLTVMAFFARWRAERDAAAKGGDVRRRPVSRARRRPTSNGWSQAATRGDVDHARWELRYARRALGLIAAQRDALDDRTASIVARAISEAFGRDQNIAARMVDTSERQFNARLSAYRDGLAAKAGAPTAIRMGQTLFAFAGGSFKHAGREHRSRRRASRPRTSPRRTRPCARASECAVLPEIIAPSALASHDA